ncbi:hypothetical protein DL96DRAFT_1631356 [Flagelloscypha sp. PMI_526]|nr:hypothetical protein DL96DRAFT_1631356 [Flagelloscypha sp. PMI_526]
MPSSGTPFRYAANHAVNSLADPVHPKHCVQYYLYIVHALCPYQTGPRQIVSTRKGSLLASSAPFPQLVRTQSPHLLKAFMGFIRHSRSRSDMDHLVSVMETCSCDRDNDAFVDEAHDWSWLSDSERESMAPPSLICLETNMITLISSMAHLLALSINLDSQRGWGSFSDAVGWPGNGITVVTQLCRWLDVTTSVEVVELLNSFMVPGPDSPMVDAMLRSATLPRSIVIILEKFYEASPSLKRLAIAARSRHVTDVHTIIELSENLSSTEDGVSIAYFYEDQAEPFLDVVSRLDRKLFQPAWDSRWSNMLRKHAVPIHEKLCLPLDPTRYAPDIIAGFKKRRNFSYRYRTKDPYKTTQDIMHALRRLRSCGNQSCPNEHLEVNRWYQCGRCHRVLYCSKECQKKDWKDSRKPHEKICDTLELLSTLANFPDAARGKALPRRRSDDKFELICDEAGLDTRTILKVNQLLMNDDRIMKLLQTVYSPRYKWRIS